MQTEHVLNQEVCGLPGGGELGESDEVRGL